MRCPVCKKSLIESEYGVDLHNNSLTDGDYCMEGHYRFSDANGFEGFYIRIGNKEMKDLYAHSIRTCRIQNMIINRWIKNERKRYKILQLKIK